MPLQHPGPAKIINWKEYNTSLVRRGSVSLLLAVENRPVATGRKGRPETYSSAWIEAILLAGLAFRLPLRQLSGFISDWVAAAGLDLPVPSFSTLCERRQRMSLARRDQFHRQAVKLATEVRAGRGAIICVDSTGLSIRGAGSWRQSRVWDVDARKRRSFLKLHIAMDPRTRKVISYLPTTASTADSSAVKPLLEAIGPPQTVATLVADGAYDQQSVYRALDDHGAREARIPPKAGAKPWKMTRPGAFLRNNNLTMGTRHRDFVPGGEAWRRHTRYGIRSLVETTFSRLQALSSNRLKCRSESGRMTEVHLLLDLLNRHAALGLPVRQFQALP